MRRRKVFYVYRMMMLHRNIVLQSRHNRSFLIDVFYQADRKAKPVVIFSHGFKGFKDWGPFDLIADRFAQAGFIFIKFNFSHNGTSIDHPFDFVDLEAFGHNNMSIEMDDLGVVLDWVNSENFIVDGIETNTDKIYLLGHSRGGGITILKAQEDSRVKKICTWASVNEFGKYWKKDEMEKIKHDGVIFVGNARTNQQMPLYWQLYQNYFDNLERLHIPTAVKKIKIPFLIIHGTDDETVPYTAALEMNQWNKQTQLLLLEHANHNFGGCHPYNKDLLTDDLEDAISATIDFFKS
ncbi:MAG: alpha/beta fold hydrolase [Chitinophagales bacterium]